MGAMMSAPNGTIEVPLAWKDTDPRATMQGYSGAFKAGGLYYKRIHAMGQIRVSASIVDESVEHGIVSFQMSASSLDKMDRFGKSDPYCIVYRALVPDADTNNSSQWVPVFRTNMLKKTLDPVWDPVSLPLCAFVANDYHRMLRFDVFDWDRGSADDLIGRGFSTLADMMAGEVSVDLISPEKSAKAAKKNKSYTNSGVLTLSNAQVTPTTGSQLDLPPPLDNIEMLAWERWSVDDVATFLVREHKYDPEFADRFREHEIDGPAFVMLNDVDLKNDLGMTVLGRRKHLLGLIHALKRDSDSVSSSRGLGGSGMGGALAL